MLKHKVTFILIVLASSTVAFTARAKFDNEAPVKGGALAQAQTDPDKLKKRLDFEAQFPAANYDAQDPELSDPEKHARRKAKNSRYDKYSFGLSDPTPRVNETSIETEWSLHLDPLPAARSDVVLVGEVIKASAHLSNNKKGIYSEFTVRVEEVLKAPEAAQLAVGGLIAVERLGGTVVYPAGNKRIIRVTGQSMPRVNRRYLLFLNATQSDQDFSLLTGYELKEGKVIPLDDSTRMNSYQGMDQDTFLNDVREVLGRAPQGDAQKK
jgi:hypothetical protein